MHQQIQTTLATIEIGQTSKGPIYKFHDSYGTEYTTFRQAIAEQAKVLIGMPAIVTYDSQPSKDGRFENRYLENVELVNGQMGMPAPVPVPQAMGTAPLPQGIPPFAGASQPASVGPQAPEMAPAMAEPYVPQHFQNAKHPEEQLAIRRAVALNNAVLTLPNLENKIQSPGEVLAIAEVWERWLAGDPPTHTP
jgi:hypothetical protein